MREETRVFLNTWGAYNEGFIGFGWMTPSEAIDFMNEKLEDKSFIAKFGEEFFIADIDNYLDIDFGNTDYGNVNDICEQIEALEELKDYELEEVKAVMEYEGCGALEAIEKKDNYIIYADKESFFDSLDDLLHPVIDQCESILSLYFDYEAYHESELMNAYEASNGAIIIR